MILECCAEMKAAQERGEVRIRYRDKTDDENGYISTSYESLEGIRESGYFLWWNEASQAYGKPLKYCPWCAKILLGVNES